MGGSEPAGNSTSTTGPMTWVIFPLWVWISGMSVFPRDLLERLGATHDLAQFLGDVGLPRAVVLEGERADHLVRVPGGGLHGGHARAVLAGRRVEQRPPHLHVAVSGDDVGAQL